MISLRFNMKSTFLFLFIALTFILSSCGDKSEVKSNSAQEEKSNAQRDLANMDPLLIEIHDMERKAKLDSVMDRAVGLRLLRAYQEYYNKNMKDSLGIAYLFEAARVADAMSKYEKAIELLINYHDVINNQEKKAESAYMVAFIYDAHLKNEKKAITYYNKVIELYPSSVWAEQAKSALHLVGKSDEDLLKFLEEKNKQPS
jgi:tetratricopeptide (TPR) repeat protein